MTVRAGALGWMLALACGREATPAAAPAPAVTVQRAGVASTLKANEELRLLPGLDGDVGAAAATARDLIDGADEDR